MRKLRKYRKLRELNKLKNIEILTESIVKIINKSKIEFQKIKEGCKNLDLEERTIDAMIQGKDIKDCQYCNTHNMCEVKYDIDKKTKIYECYKCGETMTIPISLEEELNG